MAVATAFAAVTINCKTVHKPPSLCVLPFPHFLIESNGVMVETGRRRSHCASDVYILPNLILTKVGAGRVSSQPCIKDQDSSFTPMFQRPKAAVGTTDLKTCS